MPTFDLLRGYQSIWWTAIGMTLLLGSLSIAAAGPREQAFRIHNRLAGVPPDETTLLTMEASVSSGQAGAIAAALSATNNPNFYTVTLKNFAAPWTNREQSVFVPLNDYTTLAIGLVKDNLPFDQILYTDLLYVQQGVAPPAANNNTHYENLEQAMLQPGFDPVTQIVQASQSAVYGLPAGASAGAITTRAAAEAFFIAGTNRAMFRFTLMNHMCMDLEQVHDTSIAPGRIRQDVSRSPGGDSRVFLNNCIGCHSGMDPMAQAFAYYNYDEVLGRLVYTPGQVAAKYFNNDTTFEDGFVTPDDSWDNYWREGQNALIGWGPGTGSGAGARTLGMELAGTDAFAECQVTKVFRNVCLRNPVNQLDRDQITAMTGSFRAAYDLRQVFAESAVYCMGN